MATQHTGGHLSSSLERQTLAGQNPWPGALNLELLSWGQQVLPVVDHSGHLSSFLKDSPHHYGEDMYAS